MSDSTFIRNFDAEATKIKEIISTPANVLQYLENLKIIHSSIENMIEQYQKTGIKSIKKELFEYGVSLSQVYKTTLKTDLPSHVPKSAYSLPIFQEPKFEIELFSDDIYDDLFDYVDENIDVNTAAGKRTIAKFFNIQKEIIKELDETRELIKTFEQTLVNFREAQLLNIKNVILPTLYTAHMSYVKCLNKNPVQINITPYIITIVSGRQTEFIPASLKTWLGL